MKLALLCGLLFLATVLAISDRRLIWRMRADTFVHRTFDNESPDAHYYHLRISRGDVIVPGEENLHVILNEISDPEANIKMYIKKDSEEMLKDLTAEGVQEYESRHAEFVLTVPTPPKEDFAIAIVCDKQGVEYSVSACMGDECSETSTAGLIAEPFRPKYPGSIRGKKHLAELMSSQTEKRAEERAENQAAMSENRAKRAFPPPPKLILQPTSAMTPLTFFALGDPMFSHDQSGLEATYASVNGEFDPACGLLHTGFALETHFFPNSPFTVVGNVPPYEITYNFDPGTMLDGICFWAGSSTLHRIIRLSVSVSTDGMTFTTVVPDFAVPPPVMPGMPQPGIPIDFGSIMGASQVRITALEVTSQNLMVIAELAGRVVPDPDPILTLCLGLNCQCLIPNCDAENNPPENCPKCEQCLAIEGGCTVINPVLDMGFEINQGDVVIPNDGCLVFNTLANSITGTIGQDCLFLGPDARITGGIDMQGMTDCVINRGADVFGPIELRDGNNCYFGSGQSTTSVINGGPNDDFIVINDDSTTDAPSILMPINGGGGNDCISITDSTVGVINGGAGDDCVYAHGFSQTAAINGQAGQDHIVINDAEVNEIIAGGPGDDIVEVDAGLVFDDIVGGSGDDEVYLFGAEHDAAIVTNAGNDIIVTGLMTLTGDINSGAGNDCIEVTGTAHLGVADTISGGSGDDQMFVFENPDIGPILGGSGCDLIVSCVNGASIGTGPIFDVNGGADEDLCFVDIVGNLAGPQSCELRGDGVDAMGMPDDCEDPRLDFGTMGP